ncbi:MAG: hypothetical protein JWM57_786 [Phycisphaerales bacterium]|nr:hypothetical protein [Phycisphaerales bacterium]
MRESAAVVGAGHLMIPVLLHEPQRLHGLFVAVGNYEFRDGHRMNGQLRCFAARIAPQDVNVDSTYPFIGSCRRHFQTPLKRRLARVDLSKVISLMTFTAASGESIRKEHNDNAWATLQTAGRRAHSKSINSLPLAMSATG